MTKNINREDACISNTIISQFKYDKDFNKELDFCKKLEYQHYEDGRAESSFNRGVLFEKEMSEIREFIQQSLENYSKNVLGGSPLLLAQSWVGRQEQGQSVQEHKHISAINGCFYFTVPDDTTPLVFNRTNQVGVTDDFRVAVNQGGLILFPNKLEHWVPENKNPETRYVIGFNSRHPEVISEWKKIGAFYSEQEGK
jgi:hypothetical protein